MSRHVTVVSRQGCTPCVAAYEAVARICADTGDEYSTVDVDGDPELRARYGDLVPVILIDGAEHGYWTVEEDRLRRALSA